MTRDERIAKMRGGCWIGYTRAEQVARQLDDLLSLAKTHRMPNVLIVGETNNGKRRSSRVFFGSIGRRPMAPARRAFRSSPCRHALTG